MVGIASILAVSGTAEASMDRAIGTECLSRKFASFGMSQTLPHDD
jgi:hypothetical protein